MPRFSLFRFFGGDFEVPPKTKAPREFELTALRTRVSEAEKIALSVVKSPRSRRFLRSKSPREKSIGEDVRRFGEILSVSIFRRGLWC